MSSKLEQIRILVETKPKHYTRMINKDPEMIETISPHYGDTVPEKVFNLLHPETQVVCPQGNNKKFKSVTEGYIFCGTTANCACANASMKESVSKIKLAATSEEKAATNERRAKTNLEKYGVENIGQTEKAKAAHADFYAALPRKEKVKKEKPPKEPKLRARKPSTPVDAESAARYAAHITDSTCKYSRWYRNIVQAAALRTIDTYTESHHIIPRSMGGSDEKANRVDLTAREHFICHWLLTKIFKSGKGQWKMLNALRMMRADNSRDKTKRYSTKITARVYESIRETYAKLQSEKNSGEGNPMHGSKFYRSPDGRERQRTAIMGEKNGAKSPEARKKISEKMKARKRAASMLSNQATSADTAAD